MRESHDDSMMINLKFVDVNFTQNNKKTTTTFLKLHKKKLPQCRYSAEGISERVDRECEINFKRLMMMIKLNGRSTRQKKCINLTSNIGDSYTFHLEYLCSAGSSV